MTPIQHADGSFIVESTSGADRAYKVTIEGTGSCSCPHFTYRLIGTGQQCRHIEAVHQHIEQTKPTALQTAAAKAKALRDEELLRLARQYQGQAAGAACLLELAQRQAAAERDASMKELFS